MRLRTIYAADLFCGAGGTSTGLLWAAQELGLKVDLIAVNHWTVAIKTHSANHTLANHLCESLDGVDPRKVIPSGRLDILMASPECTHHSNARGGRPMSDQSRASGWHVIRWAEALRIDSILVENVREWQSWGPIGANGRPLKSHRGETFQAWVEALKSLNYSVEYQVLNSADHGVPQTRERLFVLATRGRRVPWPRRGHDRDPKVRAAFGFQPWRSAREDVIDWTNKGVSIFGRKKPLAKNTIKRITKGLLKYSAIDMKWSDLYRMTKKSSAAMHAGNLSKLKAPPPFLVKLYGTSSTASVDGPASTVTGQGGHLAIAQPFMLGQQSLAEPRSMDMPAPTVQGRGAISQVRPFIVANFGEKAGQEPRVHSVDRPAPTATPRGAGDLVQPFITEFHGGEGHEDRVKSVDDPVPTQTAEPRFGLTQPFMMSAGGPVADPRSVDLPGHTVLGRDRIGLTQPFILPKEGFFKGNVARSIDAPAPTVVTDGRMHLVQPFIVGAGGPSGAGRPQSVDQPVGTVMGENHRAIIFPVTHSPRPGEDHGKRVRSVNEPCVTVTCAKRGELALAQVKEMGSAPGRRKKPGKGNPDAVSCMLIQYNGTADAKSIEEPVGTITGKPRYALMFVFKDGSNRILDITFRMFMPRELARVQSFPDDYVFTGTASDVVKQIGNAVPPKMAKALCKGLLAHLAKPTRRRQ